MKAKKTPGTARNQDAAKSGGKTKNNKRMGKRLLKDLIAFLKGLPAFTFVLYSRGISSYGPNLISALDMMSNGSLGTPTLYSGPLPESKFAAAKVEAARRYEEIAESVWARVMQLRHRGVSCVLYWHAFGDANQNYFGCNIHNESAWDGVADFLAERTYERIHSGE